MNKKTFLGLSMVIAGISQAPAETPSSFEEFRQGILNDFQEFRNTILSHYADFLEGTWHEYEPLEPLTKNEVPKPAKMPDITLNKPTVGTVTLPTPSIAPLPGQAKPSLSDQLGDKARPGQSAPVTTPNLPDSPAPIKSPFDKPKTEIPPEAKSEVPLSLGVKPDLGAPILATVPNMVAPQVPEEPEIAEEPESPAAPAKEESREGKEVVNFYGMDILVPQVDFNISRSLEKVSDFARHWKTLDDQEVAERVEEAVMPVVKKLGLNDYLTYEFLCAYMDSKFPDCGISPRMSAVHYMLANLGYNARIAVATKTGDPIILIPAEQTLYAVTYMQLGGQKFYVLGGRNVNLAGSSLATCDLPKGASSGKKFNMIINELNLPMKERKFDVNYGGLHLTGTMNENMMPLVYRYPQMETSDYAISTLDPSLRRSLVAQVKEQLGGKESLEATNKLLDFVQNGFQYATDDEFHGFEKPYFLEENFYYPKNDCEDRSIIYTYLLWNALGVENQLLAFPGHESASVTIPGVDISGTSYTHDGKRYFISDPTYIGARTGQCMRQFETTSPTIDYTYKR